VLLWISSRPKRQRAARFPGGDERAASSARRGLGVFGRYRAGGAVSAIGSWRASVLGVARSVIGLECWQCFVEELMVAMIVGVLVKVADVEGCRGRFESVP
jgi:hypothetical protein